MDRIWIKYTPDQTEPNFLPRFVAVLSIDWLIDWLVLKKFLKFRVLLWNWQEKSHAPETDDKVELPDGVRFFDFAVDSDSVSGGRWSTSPFSSFPATVSTSLSSTSLPDKSIGTELSSDAAATSDWLLDCAKRVDRTGRIVGAFGAISSALLSKGPIFSSVLSSLPIAENPGTFWAGGVESGKRSTISLSDRLRWPNEESGLSGTFAARGLSGTFAARGLSGTFAARTSVVENAAGRGVSGILMGAMGGGRENPLFVGEALAVSSESSRTTRISLGETSLSPMVSRFGDGVSKWTFEGEIGVRSDGWLVLLTAGKLNGNTVENDANGLAINQSINQSIKRWSNDQSNNQSINRLNNRPNITWSTKLTFWNRI